MSPVITRPSTENSDSPPQPISSMLKCLTITIAFAALLAPASVTAGPPIFKCSIDGSVSYQHVPCPAGDGRKPPTVEQLNAERQKKLRQSSGGSSRGATATASPAGTFRCDGRTHCSQMSSCAEARHFLAHCPGVQMEGDQNGIPCERQWCSR